MIIFVVCPLIYIIVLSFMTRGTSGGVVFNFTLSNYARIFDIKYINIFKTSFYLAFLTTLITLVVAYPFSFIVARMNKLASMMILLILMVPFWTSSLLRTYGWIIIMRTQGVLNTFLLWLGVIDEPIKIMGTNASVVIVMVYMLLPLMILPLYNSIIKLDKSMIEASYDLNAGKLRTFIKVVLPLTLSGITGGITLVFIPAVGLYFVSDLMGNSLILLIGNLIENQLSAARNWPFGAALSVVLLIITSVFIAVYFKLNKNPEDII